MMGPPHISEPDKIVEIADQRALLARRPLHRGAVEDFWTPETVMAMMDATGLAPVTVERQHARYEQNLRVWLDTVRRRDTCSQLMTIPDTVYEAGISRSEHELADARAPLVRADHLCFVTIRGEKTAGIS
jgi:hypothetical protein